MNFYKHHIGDYAQATAHLSFVEDAAYTRCLRKYYAEEEPLPADLKAVQRLVGARTREEKEAVQLVLEEFFELQDDGWHNKRADEELGKANAQAEANRKTAIEREEKRRARKEHESLQGSLHESTTNRADPSTTNRSEVVNLARHQTPDTRLQTPEEQETTDPSGLVAGTAYRPPPSPNAEIVELYRKNLPQLPGVEVLNDSRKRAIAARWREVCVDGKLDKAAGLEWFDWYFAHVAKSKFLTGQIPGKSGRIWQADFDFLTNASKFPRVVEGSYHKDAA